MRKVQRSAGFGAETMMTAAEIRDDNSSAEIGVGAVAIVGVTTATSS
jgi:hypothetical protein